VAGVPATSSLASKLVSLPEGLREREDSSFATFNVLS
jgi:hypothetical protein